MKIDGLKKTYATTRDVDPRIPALSRSEMKPLHMEVIIYVGEIHVKLVTTMDKYYDSMPRN
jgi:NADH:ubiquinone oxidoreductase subunit B-like Fe-S oxidoreductase